MKRTTTGIFKTDVTDVIDSSRFLEDYLNITHLFLDLGDKINEAEEIHIAIEDSLRAHNGLVKLNAISGVTVRPEERLALILRRWFQTASSVVTYMALRATCLIELVAIRSLIMLIGRGVD